MQNFEADFSRFLREGSRVAARGEDTFFEDAGWIDFLGRQSAACQHQFFEVLIRAAAQNLVPGSFRAYDIRIDAGRLSNAVVFYMGLKMAVLLPAMLRQEGGDLVRLGVGRAAAHARPSSQRIHTVYTAALRCQGVEVMDLGVTTTPDVYFALAYFKKHLHAAVNITASHNPPCDNGIKHCLASGDGFIYSLTAEQMNRLKQQVLPGGQEKETSDQALLRRGFKPDAPPVRKAFADEDALARLHHAWILACAVLGDEAVRVLHARAGGDLGVFLGYFGLTRDTAEPTRLLRKFFDSGLECVQRQLDLPERSLRSENWRPEPLADCAIILDYGRGSAHRSGEVYRALGAEVVELNGERGFNPLETVNQDGLRRALVESDAKSVAKELVGIAHDEDGDRLLVMRPDGVALGGDRLLALYAGGMDRKNFGTKMPLVILEVKSRPEVRAALKDQGVQVLVVPTGFAYIKEAAIRIERHLESLKRGGNEPPLLTLYGQSVDGRAVTPVQAWAELSGHFGLAHDISYLFDDATLMAVKFLVMLATRRPPGFSGSWLTHWDESLPAFPGSGELNVFVRTEDLSYVPSQEEKEALVGVFRAELQGVAAVDRVDTTDGIQVFFKTAGGDYGGWVLIRRSNNEDKLVMVTSAPDGESLDRVEMLLFRTARNVQVGPISGLVLTKGDEQGANRHADPYVARRMQELGLK